MGNANGKPTRCPICREQLSSGKALGGHMSRHKAARQRRAATLAAKGAAPKTTKCKICGESMGSGRAIGGHMSKHAKAGRPAAALAGRVTYPRGPQDPKNPLRSTPEARKQVAGIRARLANLANQAGQGHRATSIVWPRKSGNVTVDFGPAMNKTLAIVEGLHAASKEKRAEAAKLELQAKQDREDANELDRLAERIEHLL